MSHSTAALSAALCAVILCVLQVEVQMTFLELIWGRRRLSPANGTSHEAGQAKIGSIALLSPS
jgi:hypothetical protein